MRPRLLRHPRAVLGTAGVVLIALSAAACGGGSPTSVARIGTTTSTTTAASPAGGGPSGGVVADLTKYTACMRAHGVVGFPDPSVLSSVPGGPDSAVKLALPPGVRDSPKFKPAQQECRGLLPAGVGRPTITPQQQADYLQAAACMRSHGITGFPDPVFTNGKVHFPVPAGMNANSTQFLRAREICEMLIPSGLPYSKQAEAGK